MKDPPLSKETHLLCCLPTRGIGRDEALYNHKH